MQYRCNERPSQATETPSVEKHAHPPRVVYCAIYLTLTLITKFRVSNLLPLPRRLVPSLGLGTTWVRQLRSGSCHHPTAATKCNERPSQATETPSVEKHAHPPRVVYCAIYLTLTLITKFRVSNLHITTRLYSANTLHQRILQGRLSRYITF